MSSRGLRADCEAAIDSDSGSKWIARLYKHHCQQNVDQRSLKARWRGCGAVGKKETDRDGRDFAPPGKITSGSDALTPKG